MLSDWFNRAKNEALKHIETGYFRNLNLYLEPVCWIAKHVKQRVDNDAQPSQHIGWNVRLLKTCPDGCMIKKELMFMCERVVCTLLSLLAYGSTAKTVAAGTLHIR